MAGIHQEMNWGAGCYGNMGMLMEYRKISPTSWLSPCST